MNFLTILSVVFLLFTSSYSDILKPGTKAPGFSMLSVSGTREILSVWCGEKLSKPYVNSKKHTVIVSFWATYCAPCQKEIPELHDFYEKHKNEDIKIFLVAIDEKGSSVVTPFVNKKGYTLPVLFDPYKKTAERYGVTSLPSLFVISPDGIIKFASEGYHQDVSLEDILENAINDKAQTVSDSAKVVNDDVAQRQISPKSKWHAVALVECGTSPDSVASKLGVETDSIKTWYQQLKRSAIGLWSSKK